MKNMSYDTGKIKDFPSLPGVYIMRDAKGNVLYVGKAKNLKGRIRQYFFPSGDTRAMIPHLMAKVRDIETIVVSSEKEALLLENNLIKKYTPKYNALLKDDKTYIALKVTTKHEWPMVSLVRYRGKPKADALYFGPYTSAYAARETLDLIQKVFPLRQCSDQELKRRTRPCILYDMKRCIAPCVGKCTKKEYDEEVKRTVQFLRGHNKEVLEQLKMKMERHSERLEFEKAGEMLKKIKSIEKTLEKQVVDKPLGRDIDSLGIYREGHEVLLVKMIFRSGKLTGVKPFNFAKVAEDDLELLTRFILQHYISEPMLPHEILVPYRIADAKELSEIISQGHSRKAAITKPDRGQKKSLIDMAEKNARAAFTQEKDQDAITERTLLKMQETLRLNHYPKRIECIDNSNLSLSEPVSAVIVYTQGKQDKQHYRKYKVKAAKPGDDYGAMYEVLMRRFTKLKEENNLPDLLIVDGGRGQLNVSLRVFKDLNIISVDAIALVKEQGRHDRGQTAEKIFLPNVKDPLSLPRNSPVLFLLQQIRDEAHRFAVAFHRKRRSKERLSSILEKIPGVGEAKRKLLLKHLGSLQRVKDASLGELERVPKISKKDASIIKEFFSQTEEE